MLAWLIDLGWFFLWMMGFSMVFGLLAPYLGKEVSQGLMSLGFFLLNWFYFVVYEVYRGASPGKKSMGLKVVCTSGAPVGWGASMLRNLLRFVDFLPFGYLFGVCACLSNRHFQRIGDLVADTMVIYDRSDFATDKPMRWVAPPVAPSAALSREEQLALVQFIERSELWSQSRKEELVAHLGPFIGETGPEGVVHTLAIGAWIRDS